MQIVRKKLSPDEITPPYLRYDAGCDCIQVSSDGGTTWDNAPGLDPRTNPAGRLPPLSGPDARCDAAIRMRSQIEEQVDRAILWESVAGIASSFLFGLGLLVFAVGWLVGLFLLIADTMITIGISAIVNAMTSSVYDELECIIYCYLDDNGQLQVEALEGLREQVNEDIGGVAALVLGLMFDAHGAVILSNAAVVRTETGDCDECESCRWCVTFDFTASDWGWHPDETSSSTILATWTSGVGWTRAGSSYPDYQSRAVFIHRDIGATVTKMVVERIDQNQSARIWSWESSFYPSEDGYVDFHDFGDFEYVPPGGEIYAPAIGVGFDVGGGHGVLTTVITRITLWGRGEPPDIGEPCPE